MCLIITFIFFILTNILQIWTEEIKEPNYRLVISPPGHPFGNGPSVIYKRVDDSLNLTCRLETKEDENDPKYNISWNWQYGNNAHRVMNMSLSHNEANLVFSSLKETDSGEYTCKCPDLLLSQNVRVWVKSRKKYCSEKNFMCSNGYCIVRHYVCDGRQDCKDGSDEMFDNCGANPCEGKIPCEDGRCIPTAWCCDELHDPNCTVKNKPKCCNQLIKPWHDADHVYSEQNYNDMGFLQTTIYTVIGCAMAFMFIVTILVIAICRVHIKRTIVSRCPLNHQHLRPNSPLRPSLPLYDFDMFLDRHTEGGVHPGFLVTYNINNGVQFVGRPVDPPPYCEFNDMPPREGPPPPYVSRENICQSNDRVHGAGLAMTNQCASEDVGSVSESTECDCTSNRENDTNYSSNDNTQPFSGDDVCSSPSVSGLNNTNNSNRTFRDSCSDSESDSMESDALLTEATIEKEPNKPTDEIKVIRSSSLTGNISSSPPNNFLNNITAVSKTLIGSLKRQTDEKSKNKQLKTQKSFDSSEPCDIKHNGETDIKVTHSVGDLSPVTADIERLDFLTLPLRESFIGLRNEDL